MLASKPGYPRVEVEEKKKEVIRKALKYADQFDPENICNFAIRSAKTIRERMGGITMAKKRTKGIRHCITTKRTRAGTKCAAYAPGPRLGDYGDIGDYGDLGRVARVITIPGKGIRCQDERGKFTTCLAGDLGDMGKVRRTARRAGRRAGRRVTQRSLLGEYIPGKGYRCRTATGQFTQCR